MLSDLELEHSKALSNRILFSCAGLSKVDLTKRRIAELVPTPLAILLS